VRTGLKENFRAPFTWKYADSELVGFLIREEPFEYIKVYYEMNSGNGFQENCCGLFQAAAGL
jgi:hypothetical protein